MKLLDQMDSAVFDLDRPIGRNMEPTRRRFAVYLCGDTARSGLCKGCREQAFLLCDGKKERRVIQRWFLFVALALLPVSGVLAQGVVPTLGVYLDSFTGVSGKGGLMYAFSSLKDAEDTSFALYSDVEFGTQANKITIGPAYVTGHSFSRLGISFARKDSEDYVGVEALHFVLLFSFKIGVYKDPASDRNVLSAGIGFGF